MEGKKSFSVSLSEYVCSYLEDVSRYLGVKEEDVIRLLLDAVALNFPRLEFEGEVNSTVKSFKLSKFDAFQSTLCDTIHVGVLSRALFKNLFDAFNCSKLWPSIEDMWSLDDCEGIEMNFTLEKSQYISDVYVTLFTYGSDYIQVESIIGNREELGEDYDKIKKDFAKAVEKVEYELEELEDEMDTDLELNILDDEYLVLRLEGGLSERRLPDLMEVERLFKKLYKYASVKRNLK